MAEHSVYECETEYTSTFNALGFSRARLCSDGAHVKSAIRSSRQDRARVRKCIAGAIYGLYALGQGLDWREGCQAAVDLVCAIPDELIDASEELDVMFGTAGLSLVVTSILKIEQNAALRAKAEIVSRKLEKQVLAFIHEGIKNVGFGHGLGGIVAAIVRAEKTVRRFGEVDVLKLIEQLARAIDRDISVEAATVLPLSWCNGLAGALVGLAEAHSQYPRVVDSPLINAWQSAMKFVGANRVSATLCCGSLGLVQAGLRISKLTGDKAIGVDAVRIFEQATSEDTFWESFGTDGLHSSMRFGLFQGLAGLAETAAACSRDTCGSICALDFA